MALTRRATQYLAALTALLLLTAALLACGNGDVPDTDRQTTVAATTPPTAGSTAGATTSQPTPGSPSADQEPAQTKAATQTAGTAAPAVTSPTTQATAQPGSTQPPSSSPDLTATLEPTATPPPTQVPPRPQVTNPSPETDRAALMAFYDLTNGDEWDLSRSWNGFGEIETWNGVEVENGRVTRLSIWESPSSISREAMAHLGDLSELRALTIFRSAYPDGLAPELVHLQKLTGLEISGPMGAPLPQFLTELTNLITLSISETELTGPIPTFLAEIPNLERLTLTQNSFSGTIPVELFLGPSLEYVDLHNNHLTTLPAGLTSTKVRWLNMGGNPLS